MSMCSILFFLIAKLAISIIICKYFPQKLRIISRLVTKEGQFFRLPLIFDNLTLQILHKSTLLKSAYIIPG